MSCAILLFRRQFGPMWIEDALYCERSVSVKNRCFAIDITSECHTKNSSLLSVYCFSIYQQSNQ